ncbi:hypothetical protein OQA88_2687, partial [Cercophora sp. LCS_1]
VDKALTFIEDLVKDKGIDLKDISVLTAYSANLILIKKATKKKFSSLATLPEATTVEGHQGHEKPIIVAIMGTAHPRPGPGFTTDQRRLCVMLTRQKAALIIFGDFNVGGPYNDDGSTKKSKGGKGKETKFKVETVTGEEAFIDGRKLQGVHRELLLAKRVAGLGSE